MSDFFSNEATELIPHEAFLQRLFPTEFYDDQTDNLVNKRLFKPRRNSAEIEIKFPIDWESKDQIEDRNWRMQLQGWKMFQPIFNFFDTYEDKQTILDYFISLCEDWMSTYGEDPDDVVTNRMPDSYAWYDMSVGLRALCLTFFINRINHFQIPIESKTRELIAQTAQKHINNLSSPKTFSLNNHGIFQIHGLMGLVNLSRLDTNKQHIPYGLRQMEKLVESQFDHNGIHLEHSPGYHFFVIESFESVLRSDWYSGSKTITEIISKAIDNTKWIVDPDKHTACIGDSILTEKSRVNFPKCEVTSDYLISDFNDSGYGIIRSPWTTPTRYSSYLFFMAAYHSKTHKHRDCLSFEWFDRGHKIIVDGGKYGYKSDKYRHYCLSYRAHNNIEIEGFDVLKTSPYGSSLKTNKLFADGVYLTQASLSYPALAHSRSLYFKPSEFIIVEDSIDLKKRKTVTQRFHLSKEYTVESIDARFLKARFGRHEVFMQNLSSDASLSVHCGSPHTMEGYASEKDDKIEPSLTPSYKAELKSGKLITIIALSESSFKRAHAFINRHLKLKTEIPPSLAKEIPTLANLRHYRFERKFYEAKSTSTYSVSLQNHTFDFLYKPHKNKKLLVMLPGAVTSKSADKYDGADWIDDFDCNVVALKDPTLTNYNDLRIGWFQGTYHSYAITELATLIKTIAKKLGVKLSDILLFGSSSGGFSALQLADLLPDTPVYVANPQIYIDRYSKRDFQKLADFSYSGESHKNIVTKYANRIRVSIDFDSRNAPIIIKQNTEDEHHYSVHLTPFLEDKAYQTIQEGSTAPLNKLNIIFYSDPKNHSLLHKGNETSYIRNLLGL